MGKFYARQQVRGQSDSVKELYEFLPQRREGRKENPILAALRAEYRKNDILMSGA